MSNDVDVLADRGQSGLPTAPATLLNAPATNAPSFVVGIGASAGGLAALERFFDRVPRESGMSYVVVQHLSPDFRSLMDELLARHTELPIQLVEDGMTVVRDHVYLIPPKKEMIISGGRLLLSERDRQQHELSLPIDVFFRSLAQDCGRRAVAVVLSGGGSDGSRGIRAVHEAGGLVVVQDTESAQFDGMPKTARDAGVADWVLPPGEMPRALLDHARRGGDTPVSRESDGASHGFAAVYQMLQSEFGIDFTHYKPSTVTRRIERRLALTRTERMDDYVERLRRGRDELDVLYRDLLIGVTRFFRNEEAFDILNEQVLPEIARRLPKGAPFRAWVAGCATGEEVYSLAILLDELNSRVGARPTQIFATDVHRGSLDHAARGIYDEAAVANVSPARLERYFVRRAHDYEVIPDLRRMVVFAPHNVIRDPPFTRVDLVSCRNLLIYLQPAAQQKALSLFHFALNRGGVVFLGPSESPGALLNDFEPVDRHWRMYRKYSSSRIDVDARLQPGATVARLGIPLPLPPSPPRQSIAHLLGTYDTLLGKFMPPGLLVSDRGELVHAFSGASKFLQLRDGRQGLDVLDVVHPELRTVLLGALQRALKESTPLVLKGVHVAPTDNTLYNISIERVASASGGASLLVLFEATRAVADHEPPDRTEIELNSTSRERVAGLEQELSYTKENLQAAIEELQTSNEELQASNEELLASNEELQSTNEELQSVNEELYTVNAEYQRKIAELTELTNDMENLLAATGVGTVFLDKHLKIRKFTYPIANSFNLLPQDVGRSIETFRNRIGHAGVIDDIRHVLSTGERIEREIREDGGATSFLRLLPYRAKGAIEGVVLTVIDVSGLKAAEDALFHERYLLNSLLLSIPDAIYFKDSRGKFIRANGAMAKRLGLSDPAEAVGKTALEMPDQGAALALHRQDELVLRSGQAQHYRLEEYRQADDAKTEWDLVTRLPLRDTSGGVVGIIGVFRDVTEQKRAEEKIQEAVRRRDQFLAMLSHELRNPLGAVVMATSLLQKDVADEERRRLLGILERQSQQMARLLDDLLEVNRVTENKIELRKEVVDLRTVAREASESVRTLMETRGLSFAIDIVGEPLWVDGDAARLQQVQANLLTNAAKYTQRGGHVWLVVGREDGHGVIRVRDDGAGIAEGMLETVFELFVQAGRTLDRALGGIGVGLTLVRSLVSMHGGSVVARSDGEGRGAEFTVRLPLVVAPTEGPRNPERDGGLHLPKGARVAVIEDNADSREMLCDALTLAGFCCQSADNGLSGLALIDAMMPDVAIVDVGLPAIDGFELARRIRRDARYARVQLIALTGYGQREDRQNAMAAGFDLHLVKPIEPLHLVRLLDGEYPR
jgi:two-component system CheB/CheR fusion protein